MHSNMNSNYYNDRRQQHQQQQQPHISMGHNSVGGNGTLPSNNRKHQAQSNDGATIMTSLASSSNATLPTSFSGLSATIGVTSSGTTMHKPVPMPGSNLHESLVISGNSNINSGTTNAAEIGNVGSTGVSKRGEESNNVNNASRLHDEKRRHIKSIIDRIPTQKDDLFNYKIDRNEIDNALMDRKIRPWINKKIIEYIGEPEPTLVDFICSKVMAGSSPQSILDDVQMVC